MRRWIILSAVLATGWCCGFPGAPSHSTVTFSSDTLGPNTVATYSCDRGFELLGPSRKICGVNGTWAPAGIPFCVLNVAAGKAPMQSSVAEGGIPQKAVDGSSSTTFTTETCTLTSLERQPWWYVNLLEPYMVQLVRLDFGRSCCGDQPATVVVRVGNNRPDLDSNPICNRFIGVLEEGRPLFLPCNPPMPGAFVSVHFEGPPGVQLSICEAFVYTDQALPIERCPAFRDQPPGSTSTYNGKCYIFYNQQPQTFDQALEFCRSRGGSLVDETNPALQGFLSWELWRKHRGDSSGQYWMGAVRDPEDPNNWKWINGRDVTVSFWNLPGGNENCARFDGTKGWLWSDTNCNAPLNFICQHRPQTCGKPEQPPNSTMIGSSFTVGSTVEYRCDPGHALVGPAQRSCLDSGFFNEFPPTCRYLECGLPAPIRHGSYSLINGTRYYLSQVRYECEPGYTAIGRAELVCDIDERWNGPPPLCHPVTCDAPPPLPHGSSDLSAPTVTSGSSVTFSCDEGYVLVGRRTLTCTPEGSFSALPPRCEADEPAKPSLEGSGRPTGRPRRPSFRPDTLQPGPPYLTEVEDNVVEAANPGLATVLPSLEAGDDNHINNINTDRGQSVDDPSFDLHDEGSKATEKLHLGGIIALGVFGGFVFLAAVITTIVILVRRTQHGPAKKYVRRSDDGTASSYDSSSSDGHGLNKYYKRAWENLRESGGDLEKSNHSRLARTETLDQPDFRSTRSVGHEGLRDGSEMTVNDVAAMYTRPEKRRHHHHHHGHRHKGARDADRDHHDRQDHHDRADRHDRHDHSERNDRDWRDRDRERRKY
ncbi:uncharacterized protein LOC126999576 isoform X1 [Eriocheir sinensis]|uniref:uncharacterized protein LOC126999576 isoform X1 n=1 Tax=Eriocheir sinensis TaxID=95602 RepID=UPI0021C7D4F5|nr:uncharacterized protein LOC126999576 isoform X1 [Eriocheir sinensis]